MYIYKHTHIDNHTHTHTYPTCMHIHRYVIKTESEYKDLQH